MSTDQRTPAEVKFDLERDGTLYTEEGQLAYKRAIMRLADNVFAEMAEDDDDEDDSEDDEALSVMVSPGCNGSLTYPPRLEIDAGGTLMIGLAYRKPCPEDPPYPVREVVRLHARGLVVVDSTEETFVMTEEEYTAQVGALPAVTVRPHICDDTVDTKQFGTVIWNDYLCGAGDAEAEVYVTESAIDNRSDVPALYVFGLEAIPLDLVDRVLPNIVALANSPLVKAARARWEAQRLAAGMPLTAPHAWEPPDEMKAWIQGIRDGKRWARTGKLELVD